jgi:lipoate-protein ligase A
MAMDEALFRLREDSGEPRTPVLRFFTWERPTLSIGYFQRVESAADIEFCSDHEIPIVRRPTGGRAVLHAEEFTYSLVAGTADAPFSNSLIANYRKISEAFCLALQGFGLDVQMVRCGTRDKSSLHLPCFASAQATEVISAQGKKLVGSSQLKGKRAFLQQGSIPIAPAADLLPAAASGGRRSAPWSRALSGLSEFLDRIPPLEEFARQICEAFSKLYAVTFVESSPAPDEVELAASLEALKYSKESWNYSR